MKLSSNDIITYCLSKGSFIFVALKFDFSNTREDNVDMQLIFFLGGLVILFFLLVFYRANEACNTSHWQHADTKKHLYQQPVISSTWWFLWLSARIRLSSLWVSLSLEICGNINTSASCTKIDSKS